MADDYYELLGIEKGASREEIKKAYKRLAKKYHPDNSDTGDAERFKKINEAAAVLSDDRKRQQYDQYGSAGGQFGQGGFNYNDFSSNSDFGDIFDHLSEMFGGSFGFGNMGRGRRQTRRGEDLRYDMEITLEEAAFGVTKDISFTRLGRCDSCDGSGAASPSDIKTCSSCKGSGRVQRAQRTPFGVFQTAGVCSTCQGTGKGITKECTACDGTGMVRQKRKLDVKIPPGVDDEMRLRIDGEGESVKDGVPGDLYVFIHVKPHKTFTRRGNDLYIEYPLTPSQAAIGTEIDVPTLLGTSTLKIPEGTQPGTTFRLRDKGIQDVHSGRKGDQLIKVNVKIPTSLSRKEKKLYEELEDEGKKSGFFKRLFE